MGIQQMCMATRIPSASIAMIFKLRNVNAPKSYNS